MIYWTAQATAALETSIRRRAAANERDSDLTFGRACADKMELLVREQSVNKIVPPRLVFLCDMSRVEAATIVEELRARYLNIGVLGWGGMIDPGELSIDACSPEPHIVLIQVVNSEDLFDLVINPMLTTRYAGYKNTLAISPPTTKVASRAYH